MIWNSILSAKRDKTELHVIMLDFANAYGSVPHHLIRMALDFFNFPSKVGEIIMKYFSSTFMKFTIKDYTTKWQELEIGIMMGCVIPHFFHSGHSTYITRCSKYVERSNEKWTSDSSSFQSFYRQHHHSCPLQNRCWCLLQRYDLFSWARMKAKPKKSQSLLLVRGSVGKIHFEIGVDKIPTVREKLVKSLGHLYSIPLTDCHRSTEVQKVALKGLKSIDKTCLPGKMKVWCYQHGLLPRLLWPLLIYEIALSRIEQIQQCSNKYLWVAQSSTLFFESGFIYQYWKPTAPNILNGKRIQNWESTPSHDDEGLSRWGHSEGVSRNKVRYEVVSH